MLIFPAIRETTDPKPKPDGIVLKRTWAGEVTNVSVLVAIGVNEHGYRQVLGIVEGAKEDKAGALQKKRKTLYTTNLSHWNEDRIEERGARLFEVARQIWQHPEGDGQGFVESIFLPIWYIKILTTR
jgi:hypothetical protein